MPTQSLRFCLDDLTGIRLRCRKCNSVIELHPEKIAADGCENDCCGSLTKHAGNNPFQNLADALARVREFARHADIEFVLSKPAHSSAE